MVIKTKMSKKQGQENRNRKSRQGEMKTQKRKENKYEGITHNKILKQKLGMYTTPNKCSTDWHRDLQSTN